MLAGIHATAERRLSAGPVRMLLDGVDLRYVGATGVEAVRRVYVAVRDHNWITIPARIDDLMIREDEDGFEVTFDALHADGEVRFAWRGVIRGTVDGVVTYSMRGRAEAEFDFNRIGFCVLHPIEESRNGAYRGSGPHGEVAGRLPDLIAPQAFADGVYRALFPAVDHLAVDLPGGGRVELAFEGDLFETEDQRNWTDASHKTYCTPIALGYPHRAVRGQAIEQSVRMTIVPTGQAAPAGAGAGARARERVGLRVGAPTGKRLGALGLGDSSREEPLARPVVERLRALAPAHLRVDVRLGEPDHLDRLIRGVGFAAQLGCQLEPALFLLEDDEEALRRVAAQLREMPLARVLVFAADASSPGPRETTPPALANLVRSALGRPDVPVGGGTDMYFCELNRTRPGKDLEVISWSVNPQVHAFDARSMMETLAAQADTVRSAAAFAGGRLLVVSPVTLRPRFNANATRTVDRPAAGPALPPGADPRQASPLTAAWTLGSIAALMGAGAASVTYFQPTGPGGIADPDDTGSSDVLPAYAVFAQLAGLRGARLLSTEVSDPLRAALLAVEEPAGGTRALVANLTPEPLAVEVAGGPALALEPYAVVRFSPEGSPA